MNKQEFDRIKFGERFTDKDGKDILYQHMAENEPKKVMYAACYNYEGGHAIFTTLEKAIEVMGDICDYIEEWAVDEYTMYNDREVVWERDRSKER